MADPPFDFLDPVPEFNTWTNTQEPTDQLNTNDLLYEEQSFIE